MATFYRYLPDLSIAQVMFTAGPYRGGPRRPGPVRRAGGPRLRWLAAAVTAAGLRAAGTAVTLAGTGRLDPHGMIVIPALHDAASGQPVRYTPRSAAAPRSRSACTPPMRPSCRPSTAAVGPELTELAGLPGAPARISQVAEVYRQEPGNGISTRAESLSPSAFVLPDRVPGQPGTTSAEFASQLAQNLALRLVSDVILRGGDRAAERTRARPSWPPSQAPSGSRRPSRSAT